MDIEVYCPDNFPTPDTAYEPINVITIYDSIDKRFYTWGTKRLEKKIKGCDYVYCETENQLLECFINYINRSSPDILSGWNSEGFDIPYIINRTIRVLGEENIKRISPVENIYSRLVTGAFGREQQRWYISGISCIDYLDVYKKFSIGLRESYKLDSIAELELGSRAKEQELEGLRSLLGEHDGSLGLGDLRWQLTRKLRSGEQSLQGQQLQNHLRQTVTNQIAIDQPRYSGLKTALDT
mgnify:CR=1 FL=1